MSRLDKYRNRQTNKKLLFLVLCVGIAIVVFIKVGLRSIIDATVFINTISSGGTQENQKKEEDFFGTLAIAEPVSATNSAQIMISGSSTEYEKIDFYLNNVKVKTLSDGIDDFSVKIGPLKTGENKLSAVAQDSSEKHTKESETYKIQYINTPPSLEITSPKDGDTVPRSDLSFEGKTDSGVTLKVNNRPVVVDFQGSFKSSYSLKEGENTLEFEASDEATNTTKKTLKIRYQKDE